MSPVAAEAFGYNFSYESKPSWPVYRSLLDFAETIRQVNRDLRPFIWVQGSDEYPD